MKPKRLRHYSATFNRMIKENKHCLQKNKWYEKPATDIDGNLLFCRNNQRKAHGKSTIRFVAIDRAYGKGIVDKFDYLTGIVHDTALQ